MNIGHCSTGRYWQFEYLVCRVQKVDRALMKFRHGIGRFRDSFSNHNMFCKSNKNVPTRRDRIRVQDWAQIKVLRTRYGGDLGRCRTKFVSICFNAYQKASNVQNIKSRNSKILGENRRIVPGMSIYVSIYAHPKEKFLKISGKRIYAHPYICSSTPVLAIDSRFSVTWGPAGGYVRTKNAIKL